MIEIWFLSYDTYAHSNDEWYLGTTTGKTFSNKDE